MPAVRAGITPGAAAVAGWVSSGESTVDSPPSTPLESAGSGALRHACGTIISMEVRNAIDTSVY